MSKLDAERAELDAEDVRNAESGLLATDAQGRVWRRPGHGEHPEAAWWTSPTVQRVWLAQLFQEVSENGDAAAEGRYPTEQTCLSLREELESLAHAISVCGLSEACEAFDVSREEAESGALSTLQKTLDLLDEHDLGDDAR